MNNLSKVAILHNEASEITFEVEQFVDYLRQLGIEVQIFTESESILKFKPSCVFVLSPQLGKLTPYPTYGLLNMPRQNYLEVPRFLRNLLTYDGYFAFSPKLKQMMGDIMFGARKLGSSILPLDFYPLEVNYKQPSLEANKFKAVIYVPDYNKSNFKSAIENVLHELDCVNIVTNTKPKKSKYTSRFIVAKNASALMDILNSCGIAICLESGDDEEQIINAAVLRLVASGVVTIAHHTKYLENYFGDNLFYLPAKTSKRLLPKIIEQNIKLIKQNLEAALEKSRNAHEIFLRHFALEKLFANFKSFHEKTLVDKGYVPHPDPAIEKSLPSVTYIIRTGGKHRKFLERSLDCLVAQKYPDLRVIFVIHARFPYMEEIIQKYSSLKIKVIESIKSIRSQAIRDGMAAVETDLFGLFDDDDELFPNHVRSLVKALNYHANRDWRGEMSMAYSGSLRVDDTYVVEEIDEFKDAHKTGKYEKRAIEHYRFYSSVLMSQHLWYMPNGWLARSKFIDEELLADPELNTCEDLYFELQFAQRGHFAFSGEVTAVHHFHHFGNSTILDSDQHLPDTQRIALRNFSREFPADKLYDIADHFKLVGKPRLSKTQIAYQDTVPVLEVDYTLNQFYPFRTGQAASAGPVVHSDIKAPSHSLFMLFVIFTRLPKYFMRFIKLHPGLRKLYINKVLSYRKKHGNVATYKKIFEMLKNKKIEKLPNVRPRKNGLVFALCFGWVKSIGGSLRGIFARSR